MRQKEREEIFFFFFPLIIFSICTNINFKLNQNIAAFVVVFNLIKMFYFVFFFFASIFILCVISFEAAKIKIELLIRR